MLDGLKSALELWWEDRVVEWWYDLTDAMPKRIRSWRQKRRAKDPELVELDAFRELLVLERQLAEWPRAIPLLERAVALYDTTHQTGKRDAVLRRLAAADSTNATVQRYCDLARKAAQAKVDSLDESDRRGLETARRLMKETGRVSTSMLQRRMGIGYNHAAHLVDVLRTEHVE